MQMVDILEDFNDWLKANQKEVDQVFKILSQKLSDEPEALIGDLENADTWNARMGYLLAEANSFVDNALYYYREDKKEGFTEFDRKIILDGKVAYFRKIRDRIEALLNGIKQRLVLGSSLLGYYRSNAEFRAKAPAPLQKAANDSPF